MMLEAIGHFTIGGGGVYVLGYVSRGKCPGGKCRGGGRYISRGLVSGGGGGIYQVYVLRVSVQGYMSVFLNVFFYVFFFLGGGGGTVTI